MVKIGQGVGTKRKFGLAFASTVFSVAAFIAIYEFVQSYAYNRWQADFDNEGWYGKLTVPSSNPKLIWEYRPYGNFEDISTNRYGFRDRDYETKEKTAGFKRVAFVGDSATLGMGVPVDATFGRVYERLANRRERKVEVLSFAVDGYSAPQVEELMRTKVVFFDPDEVIYVMSLNDFDFEESSGDKVLYFNKPKSFFLRTLRKGVRTLSGDDFHRYHYRRNKGAVFESVLAMKTLAESNDIKFQVAVLPIFPEESQSFDHYPLRDLHKGIVAFCEENGIQYLDLFSAFERTEGSPHEYAVDIWHPNEKGHRVIAERFFKRDD